MSDDKFSGTPFTNDYQVRYVDGYRNGYRMGASDRAAGAEAILIDLMAGVRAAAEMNSGSAHSRILTAMANHAEAKLREVTGDE